MFFALSGYLITGVLLEAGTLRGFYARRARRLVPALLVLVAGVAVVTLTLDPLGDRAELGRTVLTALTWTGDLPFGHGSDATFHLWTLAVEEQFYLLWPLVLLVAARRGLLRRALVVTLALCLASAALTVAWLWPTPDLAYALPTPWAACFVVGAAAGIAPRRVPPAVARAALLGLLVLSVVPLRGHALTYLLGGPVIAGLTALLTLAWRDRTTVTARPWRALALLGTVSYAAYLWNYPLTLWLRPSLGGWAGPLAAALTLVASGLSLDSPMCGVASVTRWVRWQGVRREGGLEVRRASATQPACPVGGAQQPEIGDSRLSWSYVEEPALARGRRLSRRVEVVAA